MGNRRIRGEGSVFFHEGKQLWVGVISLGVGLDGSRKRITVYAQTKGGLAAKLKETKDRPKPGPADATQRLSDYLVFWLDAIKTAGCALATHESYERAVNLHIKPYLGAVPLSEINAYHAHQLFAELAKAGATNYTQRYAHRVLRSALTYAVEPLRALPANPLFGVKAPKHVTQKFSTWTAEDCTRFLEGTVDDYYHTAYVLEIDQGIRGGEVLALQWPDFDLEQGTVHVQATLNLYKGKIIGRGAPKTQSSNRVIPLTDRALKALRRQRAKLLERGLAASPWVIPGVHGGPVNRSNFRRVYKRAVERLGLSYIRPHDLRHTHGTILGQNGVSIKDISERLGHSSITTTQIYVHSDLEQQRKVTRQFSKIMEGEGE